MKVKDVKGFPEKKNIYAPGFISAKDYNQALEEVGNLEIDLRELIDEEKLYILHDKTWSEYIDKVSKKNQSDSAWYRFLYKAIKEQANELVNHDK